MEAVLDIRDANAQALAAEIAVLTGESVTQAVLRALEERRDRLRSRENPSELCRSTLEWLASLPNEPLADPRSPDEIVGYDEFGLPR